MKFELKRLGDYSDDALIKEILRVDSIVNKEVLTKKDFDALSKVTSNTIAKKFQNWKTALKKAGIGYKYSGKSITQKQRMQIGKRLTNEEILSELRQLANKLNKKELTIEDINTHSEIISPYILRSRFGSWTNAVNQSGLKISLHGKRYSDEDCYENILNLWTHLQRQPSYSEINKFPSKVGGKAYVIRWGSWTKSLEAFIERINSDTIEQKQEVHQTVILKSRDKIIEEDKRDIKLGLRWKILNRDKFRCVICGSSPAVEINCKLHVDHIIPFSKGGKTLIENLRTLCKNCNLGKGDNI